MNLAYFVICMLHISEMRTTCTDGMFLCSFKIIKLVESYHPELQPNSYQKKTMAPLFTHLSDVVLEKAASLLQEDLESSLSSGAVLDNVQLSSVTAA